MTQATDIDMREIRDLFLNLDKRIDALDKKMDVYIAQSTEQIKGLSSQILDLKTDVIDIRTQLRSQDTRLWGFVTALVLALVGLLAKLAFFPQA